ncbi:hypothetical protein TNCV_679771 [Trichonephila clavipes]|nr:hypothetical protein TNCV_679771 [Trichonephila clavipes]
MGLDERWSLHWWVGCGKQAWFQEQFWMYSKLSGKILMLDESPCCPAVEAWSEETSMSPVETSMSPVDTVACGSAWERDS